NIISKDSAATQGGLLTLGGGSAERYANLRWGDEFSTHTTYRVYGRYLDRDGTEALTASAYDDSWRMLRGGARLDTRLGSRDALTLRADGYDARSRLRTQAASFTPPFARDLEGPVRLRGGDVTAEWRHGFAGGSDAWLRAYYDEARRTEPHYTFRRHTLDLEGQHRFAWGGRHETTWGASYRVSHGVFGGSPTLQIVPAARNDDIAGLFLHNETQLWGERLRLIAGSKLEWNDYSGWNVQPSARVAWRPAARHTLWAAAARAVRTTSRLERDILLYTSLSPTQPLFARLQGNPDFQPERVLAWEAGYKAQPVAALFVDVAGFHSTYDRLASSEAAAPVVEPGRPPEPARVVVPVRIDNLQEGSASGVEAAITATVGPRWRVQGAWSFLRVNQRPRPGSTDRNDGFEGTSPRHQVWAASYLTLARGLDLDLVFRRLGRIETHGVPAFSELDARLALRPLADLELAAVGKNLLHERHVEFGGGFAVERSLLVRATFEW
ncbi:MAG TPA: TonB-dependent receptor, partial [Vicinamibacteria bacterium]|nr:TonB-dependent receptor [Vicinamibacteria bacterium]